MSAERARFRKIVGFGVAAVVLAGFAAGVACLPDLQSGASQLHPPVSGPFCGDGVIDHRSDGGEQCDPGDSGAVGCTRQCELDCVGGFVDRAADDHCYFIPQALTAVFYEDALGACKSAGAHVVTFASEETRKRVLDALGSQFNNAYWIGLSTEPMLQNAYVSAAEGEPGYDPTCTGCFVHGAGGARQIKRLSVDAGGGPWVIDYALSPSWFQLPANYNKSPSTIRPPTVICEREPPGASGEPCSGAFCVTVRATLGGKRYVVIPTSATADEARLACSTAPIDGGAPGRLVTFQKPEEREAVMQEVRAVLEPYGFENGFDKVWIGLARASDADPWMWDDGVPIGLDASPWAGNEPSDAGGTLRAYAQVDPDLHYDVQLAHADDLSARHPYVCEYPP